MGSIGVACLAGQAHALSQVSRRDVEHVDVVDSHDLFEVVYRYDVFDQYGHERVVIGLVDVVRHSMALTAAGHAPCADGRELRCFDDGLGFFLRVDVGDHNALRTDVEGAVDDARRVDVDAHHRGHTPEIARPSQVRDVVEVHGAVLAFDQDRVEAEGAEGVDEVR